MPINLLVFVKVRSYFMNYKTNVLIFVDQITPMNKLS